MALPIPITPDADPHLAPMLRIASVGRAADLDTAADFLPTGLESLDAALGGLALRRVHFLAGTRGSGATSLLHLLLAAVTPTGPVLLLDPAHCFFPTAAAAVGVHLPHLLLVEEGTPRRMGQVLAAALRADACALVVWCVTQLPAPAFLDRLRVLVRASRSALLLVATGAPFARSPADGVTLLTQHRQWAQSIAGRPVTPGRHLVVTATDHRRGRTLTVPLALTFPQPLPPLLHAVRKGGEDGGADTAYGGALDTGIRPASRCAR